MNDKHSCVPCLYKCQCRHCVYASKRKRKYKQYMASTHGCTRRLSISGDGSEKGNSDFEIPQDPPYENTTAEGDLGEEGNFQAVLIVTLNVTVHHLQGMTLASQHRARRRKGCLRGLIPSFESRDDELMRQWMRRCVGFISRSPRFLQYICVFFL